MHVQGATARIHLLSWNWNRPPDVEHKIMAPSSWSLSQFVDPWSFISPSHPTGSGVNSTRSLIKIFDTFISEFNFLKHLCLFCQSKRTDWDLSVTSCVMTPLLKKTVEMHLKTDEFHRCEAFIFTTLTGKMFDIFSHFNLYTITVMAAMDGAQKRSSKFTKWLAQWYISDWMRKPSSLASIGWWEWPFETVERWLKTTTCAR